MLQATLMEREVDLVGQLEETLKRFERNYRDLIAKTVEEIQTQFVGHRGWSVVHDATWSLFICRVLLHVSCSRVTDAPC